MEEAIEKLNYRIEFVEDKIENYERSGYFTEREISTLTTPLKIELQTLLRQKNHIETMTNQNINQ